MCKIILNNWDFSVLKSFLRALYLQILSDNPIFLSYIPKIQLIKLSSIALVAKFIKIYYARFPSEIIQYSIIIIIIIIIIIYLTKKIHSKQNTLYALSVKNVISQEMEKR